jgi:integrase/recombinase XerD
MSANTLLPFQPMVMSSAQLAAVSYLARYSGRTHDLSAAGRTALIRLV